MNPTSLETGVAKKPCGHFTAKVVVTWPTGIVSEIEAPPEFCWGTEAEAREAAKDIADQFMQRLEFNRRGHNESLH